MKNTSRAIALLLVIFLVFAFSLSEENFDQGPSSSQSQFSQEKSSFISSYIPRIPFADRQPRRGEINVLHKVIRRKFSSGSTENSMLSREKDMPRLGPGSFVYLRSKRLFAVLDNENNRIILYPEDSKKAIKSLSYPESIGIGITVDSSGKLVLLTKEMRNPKVAYQYYEVRRLQDADSRTPWGTEKTQKFSFSNAITHGSARSLEMQSVGNKLLFKGLGENEFHTLSPGAKVTEQHNGFPLESGNHIKIVPSSEEGTILIREFRQNGAQEQVLHEINSGERIDRLNSFRVLPNGLVAMDLEADYEHEYPREVVLMDSRTGEVKGRSALRMKQKLTKIFSLMIQNSINLQKARNPKRSSILRSSKRSLIENRRSLI